MNINKEILLTIVKNSGGRLEGDQEILEINEQQLCNLSKALSELFSLHVVGSSLPNRNTVISEIKNNLKEINEDKKVTNIDFDLGYSLGFFDGFDFKK